MRTIGVRHARDAGRCSLASITRSASGASCSAPGPRLRRGCTGPAGPRPPGGLSDRRRARPARRPAVHARRPSPSPPAHQSAGPHAPRHRPEPLRASRALRPAMQGRRRPSPTRSSAPVPRDRTRTSPAGPHAHQSRGTARAPVPRDCTRTRCHPELLRTSRALRREVHARRQVHARAVRAPVPRDRPPRCRPDLLRG